MGTPLRTAVTALTLLGTVVIGAAPSLATGPTTASWDFSDGVVGPVPSGGGYGSPAAFAALYTTLGLEDRDGSGDLAVDFDGWRTLAPKQTTHRTASMMSTDPAFESSPSWGSDGDSTSYDPESGDFSVSVWVRPTKASTFPLGSMSPSKISPNIIQKERATSSGGFWKISTTLESTAAGLRWSPYCAMRGISPTGTLLSATTHPSARTRVKMLDDVGYTLTCRRVNGVLSMDITADGGATVTQTASKSANFAVDNGGAVSVGHKPGTTFAGDVYDGLLDSVVITKG